MRGNFTGKPVFVSTLALSGMLMLWGRSSEAAKWQIESVDATAIGRFSSLRIDKYGNGHVAYMAEDANDSLRYAFWDASLKRWFSMVVDQHAQFCSLALDSRQRPHISYVEHGSMRGSKLRYASWDGTSWKKQSIPIISGGVAYYTSIVVDAKDNPIISFYDHMNTEGDFALRLRTVWWNGTYWESRVLDADLGSGKFNSIALDSAGRPHIAYANVRSETGSLRYGRWNGQSFDMEVLDGLRTPMPTYSVSMVLDKDDVPHITYADAGTNRIKYATRRGGNWQIEVVDHLSKVAYPDRNGIALDPNGNPYVSYYDAGRGCLELAYRRGQKWFVETVDPNFAGFTSSLQIVHASIWVTYADEGGGGLKCARSSLEQLAFAPQSRAETLAKLK